MRVESDGIDPFFQFSTFNFQLSINMRGLVIKNTGSWYTVRTDDGRDIESKIKGNFRLKDIRTTNPVAVGDRVDIDINTGRITSSAALPIFPSSRILSPRT